MDDIKKRLQETADACIKSFEKWDSGKKTPDYREDLLDAVHELRKVTSRLEIEVALSERDSSPQKPMPVPKHRDAKPSNKKGREADGNTAKGRPPAKKKAGEGNK